MSRRPNLKPKSLTTHVDKADRLGVPRSNVVDLRSQSVAAAHSSQPQADDSSATESLSWFQRRKIAKQQKRLAKLRAVPAEVFDEPVQPSTSSQAAPVAIQHAQPVSEEQPFMEQYMEYETITHDQLASQHLASDEPEAGVRINQPRGYVAGPDLMAAVNSIARQLDTTTSDVPQPAELPDYVPASAEIAAQHIEPAVVVPVAAPVPENAKLFIQPDHSPAPSVDFNQATVVGSEAETEDMQIDAEMVSEADNPVQARVVNRLAKKQARKEAKLARRLARAEAKAERKAQVVNSVIPWQQSARSLAVFVVICAVLVSPFASTAFYQRVNSIRGEVIEVSQGAVDHLTTGTRQVGDLDFATAQQSFADAETDFQQAGAQIAVVNENLTPLLKVIPEVGDQYTSAEQMLVAGEHISASAEDIAKAFTILSNLETPGLGIADTEGVDITAEVSDIAVTDVLVIAHTALRPAAPRLKRAALALSEVDPLHFPEEYRADIALAKEVVPAASQSVQQLLDLNQTLITVLGHNESKRYLVFPHNNDELRAAMGFIGTFIIVDIHKGRVRNIEIPSGGPYDLLYDLRAQVIPPSYLHYVSTEWAMHDANVWPDVPTSYQKAQWFYRQSGGSSVDGVIGLTPDVIEQLLAAAGPVAMPEYYGTLSGSATTEEEVSEETVNEEVQPSGDVSGNPVISTIDEEGIETIGEYKLDANYEITADNFRFITQAQSERKFDDTNESKKFVADLTPRLLHQVFNDVNNVTPVLQTLFTSLK